MKGIKWDGRTGFSRGDRGRRPLVVLLTALLLASVLPIALPAGAADEPQGYMVFRDSVPIGPDLDANFHAIVPDNITILSAELHLFGTRGAAPVDTLSTRTGTHNHTVLVSGIHGHQVSDEPDHNHTMTPSGDHDHPVFVYGTTFSVNDSKMDVTLPSHTHTFNGVSRVVNPFDFPPVTSDDHTHESPDHGHSTVIGLSGTHDHPTDGVGDHAHAAMDDGGHQHLSGVAGTHDHRLVPGWTTDVAGTRPSAVKIRLVDEASTTPLPGTYGDPATDWHEVVSMEGRLGFGVTDVRLSSDTPGTLEYVLVLQVDRPLAVISGHGPLGPGADMKVPLWGIPGAGSADAYLFGYDLPSTSSMTGTGGNHTHQAESEGDHGHVMDTALDHVHTVSEGDHEHTGNISSESPNTAPSTPFWNLPGHRHGVQWQGNTVTAIDNFAYGKVQSEDHDHDVVAHDHVVDLDVSGNHSHALSLDGNHTHAPSLSQSHNHDTTTAIDHDHGLTFDPWSSNTGGPTGVTATLDGTDITDDNGGPWALDKSPVILEVPATWTQLHTLGLSADTDGGVEWVVILELTSAVVMMSMTGTPGDLEAHFPIPDTVEEVMVGVQGTPYLMPFDIQTAEEGPHGHLSSEDGDHGHLSDPQGGHVHDLLDATHGHNLVLNDTGMIVDAVNTTVDLGPHTHTIPLAAFLTSSTKVVGSAGTHFHPTQPHAHGLTWELSSPHVHVGSPSGSHAHDLGVNGSHTHDMVGGEHGHGVLPGIHTDPSYEPPQDVTVRFGSSSSSWLLEGNVSDWWDVGFFGPDFLNEGGMDTLVLSADKVGTVNVLVRFFLDSTAPEMELVSGPDWVVPGERFDLGVSVPDDIDASSVSLDLGPITVLGVAHNVNASTINFTCDVPIDAIEGVFDVNITASDVVGNIANVVLGTLGIDGTPPITSLEVGSPMVLDGSDVFVTSSTPIHLASQDGTSGPGIIEYAFADTGPWMEYDPSDPSIIEGRSDGEFQLYYRGQDIAGNMEDMQAISLNLDDTSPSVAIGVHPYVAGETEGTLIAGLASYITFHPDDGDGAGPEQVWYRVYDETWESSWRQYDQAIHIQTMEPVGGAGSFTIEWKGIDRLGNAGIEGKSSKLIEFDYAAPVPSPEGDLFFSEYSRNPIAMVSGHIPGEVATIHYRTDGGSAGVLDIEPDTTFAFNITLFDGENVLLYALEDGVGNMSPWVVAGTITLDNVDPGLAMAVPSHGSKTLANKHPTIGLHFTEPVTVSEIRPKASGELIDFELTMGPLNTSAGLTLLGDLEPGDKITISMVLTDAAGNDGSVALDYWSIDEDGEGQSFIFGIIAGLVIGLIIVSLLMFWRRGGAGPMVTGPNVPYHDEVLTPDEDMAWEGEEEAEHGDEAEAEDEDAEQEEGDDDLEDEEPEDKEDGVEERTDADRPGEKGPEEAPEETDSEEDGEDDVEEDDDDTDDLEDEIDRLLEGAVKSEPPPADGPSSSQVTDLPDPDEQTVDPGSRF
jgi:hypothetical protein